MSSGVSERRRDRAPAGRDSGDSGAVRCGALGGERHGRPGRLPPHRGERPLRGRRRRRRLREARLRAWSGRRARAGRRIRRARQAGQSGSRLLLGEVGRRRDRLDREDLDEGHPRRAACRDHAQTVAAEEGHNNEIGLPAHGALRPGARHRGPRHRDGHEGTWARSASFAGDRPARHRRHHRHRPGSSGAARHRRAGCAGEGRAARLPGARKRRGRSRRSGARAVRAGQARRADVRTRGSFDGHRVRAARRVGIRRVSICAAASSRSTSPSPRATRPTTPSPRSSPSRRSACLFLPARSRFSSPGGAARSSSFPVADCSSTTATTQIPTRCALRCATWPSAPARGAA